jgi:hypothetical protein
VRILPDEIDFDLQGEIVGYSCFVLYDFLPATKLFQFTKICKSPRLTVMFSGIKIFVSSPMPIRAYP